MSHLRVGAVGLAMGLGLSLIGFADWGEVHRMFRLLDLRMLLTFAGAVVLSTLAYRALARRGGIGARRFHPGVIPGSLLFGAGWALTGACPSIALVQLGEGRLPALVSLAGMVIGVAVYRPLHERLFRWDVGSCDTP